MSHIASIIESINDQIDGVELARLTGYHPEKLQLSSSTVKCFCPVHGELAFRSLIINLKNNTYKCMMRRCACFEGGTLVEFWALFKGIEPVEAALDLAQRLKIDIDVEALKRLGENFATQAREALEGGDLEAARQAVDEAMALDSADLQLRLLSARVSEAKGDLDRAREEYLAILDAYLETRQIESARQLLGKLQEQSPDSPEVLERQIALTRLEDDARKLSDALVQKAKMLEQQGKAEEAIAALGEALDARPDDPELIRQMADLCHTAGREADRDGALMRLARLHENLGESAALLAVLERLAELHPEDLTIRERIAGALDAEGLHDQARDARLHLLDAFSQSGDLNRANAILEQMLARDPSDVALRERQAALWRHAGDDERAVEAYLTLAREAMEADAPDRVAACFDHALSIDPRNRDLRREQADWRLSSGDTETGIKELFALAASLMENGETEEGMAILDRIAELAPDDMDKRILIGRCLERSGLEDQAYASYLALARDQLANDHTDAAQAICEEARRLRPLATETLELRVETHLAMRQKPEAIEACREIARELEENNQVEAAEEVLQRALKIDRTETSAKADLARLYEKTRRVPQAAQLWIEMALFQRTAGNAADSVASVRNALRLDATNMEARVLLAEGLEASGDVEEACRYWRELGAEKAEDDPMDPEALALLKRALDKAPRDPELLAQVTRMTLAIEGPGKAQSLVVRWLNQIDEADDDEAALGAYRLAVRHYPQEVQWQGRLAGLLLESDLNDEAAEHLERMWQNQTRGEGSEAQRHTLLEKLIGLRPERRDLRAELARSNVRLGRLHEGVRLFSELAQLYVGDGALDTAVELYNEALANDPDNKDLLTASAGLLEKLESRGEAMAHYERLAELNRRMTDKTANISVLEKLVDFKPDDLALRTELAECYEADGDIDRAIEQTHKIALACAEKPAQAEEMLSVCRRLRTMAPEFVPGRELLIRALIQSRATDEAKAELDSLGDLALEMGQTEDAEKHFQRIRELDPEDIGSGERLGKLYEAGGKKVEAAEAYRQVLAIYERNGETARAAGVLQKLRALEPKNLEIQLKLARTLTTLTGERREAGEAWLQLARLALESGRADLATTVREETAGAFKLDWDWRTRLARVAEDHDDPEVALEAWHRLASDALEARESEVARDAATAGLALDDDATDLRMRRIEANRNLSAYGAAVEDRVLLARRAKADDDLDAALEHLGQALEMLPRDATLLDMQADLQFAAQRLDDARQTLRNLVEVHRGEGDTDAAIACARRIAGLDPEHTESQDYLAAVLIDADMQAEATELMRTIAEDCAGRGNLDQAVFRYSRLRELLPGDIDVLRRLTELSYESGGIASALAQFDRLVNALKAEGDAEALEEEYRRFLEREPGHLPLRERFAELLDEHGRGEEAREVWLEVMAQYRDELDQPSEALRILRHLQTIDGDQIEVREQEAVLLENLDQPADAARVWHKIAQAHLKAEDTESAVGCLVHCAELEPDKASAQLEAAELFTSLGRTEEAVQYFLRAIDIYDRAEELDACIPILERAIAVDPERLDLADALARIHERIGDVDRAIVQWLEIGERSEKAGDTAAALKIYAHLKSLSPNAEQCRERLAALHERAGNRSTALAELRDLACLARERREADREAAYLQRIIDLDSGDTEAIRALSGCWRRLERNDDLYETLSRLERIYGASGELARAIEILDELKTLRPDDPDLMGRSLDLLVKTGKTDEAAQLGIELIQVHFDRGEDQLALEMLSRVAEMEPDNVARRISLARLVHANGREQAAMQEFFLLASKLSGREAWGACLEACEAGLAIFVDDVRLRDLMGRALHRMGRDGEAIDVQLHLAALYEQRGESSKAQRVYEAILEDQPDHCDTLEAMVEWAQRHERDGLAADYLVRLAEAHYLGGALENAIEAMERIQTIEPERYDLKARLAEIYAEAGDETGAATTWLAAARGFAETAQWDRAIELYLKLQERDPGRIEVLAGLTEAYRAAGRDQDYRANALILADHYTQEGATADALRLLQDLADRITNDVEILEHLAALHREQEDTPAVVETLRRLAALHRADRQLDDARKTLDEALALAPDSIALLEEFGELNLAMGRRPEGVEQLARAARLMADGDDVDEARTLTYRILKLDPHNLTTRGLLAELLDRAGEADAALDEYLHAARGYADAHRNVEAIEILERLLQREGDHLEDRELYAKMLGRENRVEESIEQYLLLLESLREDEDPRRAIKYCRQILKVDERNPDAHAHLCDVYERSGKLRQAYKECEWLSDFFDTPGAQSQAEHYIRRALSWFPDDFGMRTRLVDLLIASERLSEAGQHLAEVAKMAEARADSRMTLWARSRACEIEPDNVENLQQLAELQERSGESEAALHTRVRLIRLLLKSGEMQPARDLAERVVDGSADPSLRGQIATMFEDAGLPEVAAFHYHALARLALVNKQFEEARQLALQVIELKPRHVAARETLIEVLLSLSENNTALEQQEKLHEIYEEAADWEGALRTLQAMIELAPSRPEPRRRIIDLYKRMHREEAMIDQLRRLVEIQVNAGDYDGAITHLRELMEIRPEDTRAPHSLYRPLSASRQ